jgi:WD40 repeat protein
MLKMDRHSIGVWRLAVSRDGQLIASGDKGGDVIIWHGEAGESLIQPIKAHPRMIYSLYFSPDGTVLTTGSSDKMMKLWDTKTWQQKENSIECGNAVRCERYSPPGTLLAIATFDNIEIYISGTKKLKCVASFKGHISTNLSLAWTPDGTRLLTGGNESDPTISEWDALT